VRKTSRTWGKKCRKSEGQSVACQILLTERQGQNVLLLETKQWRKEGTIKPSHPEETSPADKIGKKMQKNWTKKNCENFPQEQFQMSFRIGNYEAVVSVHLPRKTEKLCKTRQGITTIPEEKSSHHTTAKARTGFFILEAAFALERSLPTCDVSLVDALSVWISHPLNCHERLCHRCDTVPQFAGWGGYQKHGINYLRLSWWLSQTWNRPPPVIRAVLRVHNCDSQHFEKSKDCLNYCQFWPGSFMKIIGLWNNRNSWYPFLDSDYFQKTKTDSSLGFWGVTFFFIQPSNPSSDVVILHRPELLLPGYPGFMWG
jgi:hypothetical protein